MDYLLDTDTLTHLWHGNANVQRRLVERATEVIGIAIVTKIEVLPGRFQSLLKAATGSEVLAAQQRLTLTERSLSELAIVPFDSDASAAFERLRQSRPVRGVSRADVLIASIAIAQGAVLVTRNVRHFRPIPQLRVENWVG